MKKGFTLIELLAVIVILAIIALIAVPIVLNIINDSKESSLLRSAEFYLDAVEYTIADAFLYHGGLTDGEYPITPEGDICKVNETPCSESNTLKVEVSGDKPTSGYIELTGGTISVAELELNERTIVKNSKGELVYLKYLDDVCTLVSGTAKVAGSKYSCKADPNKDAYTFYVLTTPLNTDTSINLIMDRNICSDGSLATEDNTCTVAWYEDDNNNSYGPVTAMEYLSNATKSWINTNEMTIDKFDNDTGAKFDMQEYTTNARLPYYSEVDDYNGNNNYLYENLSSEYWSYADGQPTNNIENIYGYWTLSSSAGASSNTWFVTWDGHIGPGVVDSDGYYGVRPVINLKL